MNKSDVIEFFDRYAPTWDADQIPKDARGRFLLHDGTVFQAYWFDDEGGF